MKLLLILITILLLCLAFSGNCIDVYSRNDFPEGFVFGSGISAYQWEGAFDEDGRMPSIWDSYTHSRGGFNGDKACDGYHRYKEDVKLMADMGLDAFRISISWSRLIPGGRGPVNPKGLQFYKNFIYELTRHGIEPYVTLCQFDIPQSLEDEYGGWIDRKIIDDFTAFADVCFREFGDTVKFWAPINEPNMWAMAGYGLGIVPPCHCSPPFGLVNCSAGNSSTEPYIALHNMLLAHASTTRLYNQKYKDKQNGSVGINFLTMGLVPFSSSQEDKIATQRANDFYIGWALHPLVFGDYPDVMKRNVGKRLPTFSEEESDLVKGSFDFLGVIHYTSFYVTVNGSSKPQFGENNFNLNAELIFIGNNTLVQFGALPWGLEEALQYIKQDYGNPPVYIFENGQPTNWYHSSLDDVGRVEYLQAYIGSLLNAVRNGSDARGYFQWSFMDLFEILDYIYTYGLYYVNFSDPELKRSPKTSAFWYSAFLNGTTVSSQDMTMTSPAFASM